MRCLSCSCSSRVLGTAAAAHSSKERAVAVSIMSHELGFVSSGLVSVVMSSCVSNVSVHTLT